MIRFRNHWQGIWALCLAGLLLGCQGEPTQKKALAPSLPQPDRAVPEAAEIARGMAPVTSPPAEQALEYSYNPQGRRDPFRSILITTEVAKRLDMLPPLQRTEVAEMRVIGIVWGSLGYSAMVQTPDGKGYTIRVGTPVGPNQGVVKKITEHSLIIEEKFTDIFGEEKRREVVLELHPQKEGGE